jgi:cysteine synthase
VLLIDEILNKTFVIVVVVVIQTIAGTVTGVSQFIKQHKPELLTIAVEPEEQMLLTAAKGGEKRGPQGPHKIQGMGAVSAEEYS